MVKKEEEAEDKMEEDWRLIGGVSSEYSADERSPTSSGNESDDSSDVEMPSEVTELDSSKAELNTVSAATATTAAAAAASTSTIVTGGGGVGAGGSKAMPALNHQTDQGPSSSKGCSGAAAVQPTAASSDSKYVYPAASFANIPPDMLRQLIQTGHLQVHAEEDGNQYVTIPLSSSAASLIKGNKMAASSSTQSSNPAQVKSEQVAEKPLSIKQEYD
ncbi:uncharacterized protein Dwil_GK22205 [Drosophila willistoni]|uniref:Uncharacterized protein n=1 Tax=Drosophila willistoni TaxID=7260 RepID=A0A0Q9WR18_DROWI|nr:uncharacterized protein Dwil_GK22205 [Drosophila willistoni]